AAGGLDLLEVGGDVVHADVEGQVVLAHLRWADAAADAGLLVRDLAVVELRVARDLPPEDGGHELLHAVARGLVLERDLPPAPLRPLRARGRGGRGGLLGRRLLRCGALRCGLLRWLARGLLLGGACGHVSLPYVVAIRVDRTRWLRFPADR